MDGRRDRQMHRKIILLSHIMKGSDIASLVEFRLVVKEEIEWQTDGRMHIWTEK